MFISITFDLPHLFKLVQRLLCRPNTLAIQPLQLDLDRSTTEHSRAVEATYIGLAGGNELDGTAKKPIALNY